MSCFTQQTWSRSCAFRILTSFTCGLLDRYHPRDVRIPRFMRSPTLQSRPLGSLISIIPPPRRRDTTYLREPPCTPFTSKASINPTCPTSVTYTPIYLPHLSPGPLLVVQRTSYPRCCFSRTAVPLIDILCRLIWCEYNSLPFRRQGQCPRVVMVTRLHPGRAPFGVACIQLVG